MRSITVPFASGGVKNIIPLPKGTVYCMNFTNAVTSVAYLTADGDNPIASKTNSWVWDLTNPLKVDDGDYLRIYANASGYVTIGYTDE